MSSIKTLPPVEYVKVVDSPRAEVVGWLRVCGVLLNATLIEVKVKV
jgi:hypothetical protein